MPPTRSRLPPFAGLLAFDAAARHASMTRAADELGLTQSAISHRIRALERHFGLRLLHRLNPGLQPTEAGRRLARELAPVLGILGGLGRRLARPAARRPFRLGLGAPLLNWWLSPRLPALAQAFPHLSVEVLTWDTAAEAARAETDLALVWIHHAARDGGPRELAFPAETVFPVAAPGLAGGAGARSAWRTLPLLAKGRRGEENGPEWSWRTWLGPDAPLREAMRFRDIGATLQAALDGNGVALGRSLLVSDALRRRRLVRLAGPREACPCSKLQVARWPDPNDGDAAALAAWLAAAAAPRRTAPPLASSQPTP